MKKLNLLLSLTIMLGSSVHAVDIPKNLSWCGKQIKAYGNDLLVDTPTQVVSVSTVAAGVISYQYYNYKAGLICLDGHPNSRIMHKSGLVYMTYSDFLHKIAGLNSYGMVVEFIQQYCVSYCLISDQKINQFIALLNDLQLNNNKRLDENVEQENMILENFKTNLFMVQKNMQEELIVNAISANKNANNMYAISKFFELLSNLFGQK